MATEEGLRYIDSDGHILEHPTAMPEYAPAKYRDRIWHVETDEAGEEWLLYNNHRTPANGMSAAGVAGASDEDRARAFRGEMRYTETRPAAWNAKARLQDMEQDHIDLAVLYPTMLLGLQSETDIDFAEAFGLDEAQHFGAVLVREIGRVERDLADARRAERVIFVAGRRGRRQGDPGDGAASDPRQFQPVPHYCLQPAASPNSTHSRRA